MNTYKVNTKDEAYEIAKALSELYPDYSVVQIIDLIRPKIADEKSGILIWARLTSLFHSLGRKLA